MLILFCRERSLIQMINAGERLVVNNCNFGYLSHRIVFYLLNLHIKSRHTYFVRVIHLGGTRPQRTDVKKAGTTRDEDSYKADAHLSPLGEEYAMKMSQTLVQHREEERAASIEKGGAETPLKPLTVWTSTRRRTVDTANWLKLQGYKVRQRSQMSQLNPGVCEKMSEKRIRMEYPDEVEKHEADPYHHRYPRAEVSTEATQLRESIADVGSPIKM